MKRIGGYIKESRRNRKLSLEDLSEKTRIKKEFLVLIEKEEWNSLPDFVVLQGFVKNIAGILEEDKDKLVAFLKRDYPPKQVEVSPKPDVETKFAWTPRMTFGVGLGIVVLLVGSYLGFTYIKFVSPPKLEILAPKEGEIVEDLKVMIVGTTTSGIGIDVSGQPVLVDEEGNFSTEVDINRETEQLIIIAKSRSGKETQLVRTIKVDLKE